MANPGPSDPIQKSGSAINPDGKSSRIFDGADYSPILSNWYSAKPYGFKFTPRAGNAVIMFLPISPSNLTISTQFATSMVPTLYGTVEEHSPVRYYDITIEGTTGMGPRYVQPFESGGVFNSRTMRSRFTVQQAIHSHEMFMKTLNAAQNVPTSTLDAKTLQPATPPTGLQLDQTGYAAFHNLYRFLLKYKKDAAGVDSNGRIARPDGSHPLIFFNYKDNNQYKVVVRSMNMRRSVEDPMLYHYNITMRGYDLETAGNESASKTNINETLKALGLSGLDNEFLGQAKELATRARGVLSSVANGVNQLGR